MTYDHTYDIFSFDKMSYNAICQRENVQQEPVPRIYICTLPIRNQDDKSEYIWCY